MPTLDAATLPLAGRQLIEASAGTGKTYNITRLYIRLLLEANLGVDRILVMTFTKAATEELRGRLATLLRQAHDHWDTLDEPFFAELRQRIEPVKAKARLHQALLHLDEAAVYTIHGFCKRALTQQAFASGIGFNAEMETDSRELIIEALRDWYRRRAGDADFGLLYQHWPTPDAFFDAWANTIASSEPLPEPGVTDPQPAWQAFREQWQNEAEAFAKVNVANRRSPDKKIQWQNWFDELNGWAKQSWPGETPDLFLDKEFKTDAFKITKTLNKADQLPTLHRLTKALNQISLEQRAQLAWAGIDYARQHLAEAKDRLNQLDFNDLIVLLRQRLTEDGGEPLAAALAEQFPAALVDEFQDTDPDQYAILDRIYQKPDAGKTEPLLCMIGDPKQAIYGFRGGDVFAYLSARDNADQQWQMDTNFRSHPDVVDGYNQLFYDGGREVFGFGIDYQPVNAGAKDAAELNDPDRAAVQWGLLPAEDKPYAKDAQSTLAVWTAAEIQRLLTQASWQEKNQRPGDSSPVRPGDVAILVRDRNEAATIQMALREYGLNSVYLSSRDNVLKSAEADSLRLALHGILDLENDRALVAALATPWFGLDTEALYELHQNEHRWAELQAEVTELRERWLNQGLMSMALALFQRHVQPRPAQHERALTNSLHLLELLQQASQHHRQPWALLHWFDQARDDDRLAAEAQLRLESDADLIQVITQHGAKGLEYPIVFLPFVSYGRSARQTPSLVRYHDRHDHSARLALNPSDEEIELWQQEQIAEDIRLLYVAATRAESRLYILAAEFKEFARSPLARSMGIEQFGNVNEKLGSGSVIPDLIRDLALTTEQNPSATTTQPANLKPADFHGQIERDWWLSSFSALTRNARHGGLSNPDRDQDEPEAANTPSGELPLRFSLARGAEAGNLLHDILERLDFHQPDFDAALQAPRQRYQGLISGIKDVEPQLIDWLTEILGTELPSGARLADLPHNQTLRESEFYFPLNATTSAGRQLADILARHRGQQAVALPDPRRLKGMMHGYIDLVYHWAGRYYVVDYKSSHLGNQLARYQDPWITESVQNSYYDLQYLIYSLALHRYLATRLADYDPAQHLGGVHYLYLRGMAPGQNSGIYHREADLAAITELDRLFQGETITGATL